MQPCARISSPPDNGAPYESDIQESVCNKCKNRIIHVLASVASFDKPKCKKNATFNLEYYL